jgi:hypothetical protein
VIRIPHHPLSPNFFIENPIKKNSDFFFGITYMHSNYTTSIYPFNLEVGSMFIFGGSKMVKVPKLS